MEGEKQAGVNPLSQLVAFLREYARKHPGCTKDALAKATATRFGLVKERSVYAGSDFSIRFSTASGASFSNVVISLSALKKYDHLPFIVCVVRPSGVQPLLTNATFLKKVSHSSHQLRIDNIRGSILGSDIRRAYKSIENTPENFDDLFAIHQGFAWTENLARLVERTNAIAATGIRFEPSADERRTILDSARLAHAVVGSPEYLQLERDLSQAVQTRSEAIMRAAKTDSVKERGDRIEQIITEAENVHALEDLTRTLASGTKIGIDIKTKLFGLASNPKAYNIDKALEVLAAGDTMLCFFFVGIDRDRGRVSTRLVSAIDRTVLRATRVQFHWAGRNSRGVTQLTGDLTSIFSTAYRGVVDVAEAKAFLAELIDLKAPATK
ncbi:MAG: hypothetical protein A2V70_10870 [Planctomycetes bacterium RBG_13_63_9]|nr:MAG: hypothetical protein A2V70_10870 [Planctomycetes bacterium RBG_13_63_9]